MYKTISNLTQAFIGESQARNRYTIYAKIAQKEGFEQIAEIFLITAENEREHAKWLFRLINNLKSKSKEKNTEITVEAGFPSQLGNTQENLEASIKGEQYEYTKMYPEFAKIAKSEGFQDIAKRLLAIAVSEKHHADRYKKLLANIKNHSVFKKTKKTYWVCRKCGYVHYGLRPPEQCPSCSHPKNYFEVKSEKY